MAVEDLDRFITEKLKELPPESPDSLLLFRIKREIGVRLGRKLGLSSSEEITYTNLRKRAKEVLNSDEGAEVLIRAREEAYGYRSDKVIGVHLLLALIRESNIADMLAQHGLTETRVRNFTEFIHGYGDIGGLEFAPDAHRAVNNAFKATQPDRRVTPVHFLEALMEDQDGSVAALLECLNIDKSKLQQAISRREHAK